MGCLGVFFALTDDDKQKLFAAEGDRAVVELIQEEIEGRWDEEWICETDKAWDAMHSCLSGVTLTADGTRRVSLVFGGGEL
jgi:hypothetical protein